MKENETDLDLGIVYFSVAAVCGLGSIGCVSCVSAFATCKREERAYHDCREAKSKNLLAHSTTYLLKKEKNVISRIREFPYRHRLKIKNRRTVAAHRS